MWEEGLSIGMPAELHAKIKYVLDVGSASLEIAQRHGVKMVYGTDLIGPLHRHQSLEFAIRREVLPAIDVIRSATSTAAELFNMTGEIGRVAQGLRADLLVVAGNASRLGQVLVLRPDEGRNFWQPVPANGSISVRVAPGLVDVETPFSLGTQTLPPGAYVREHSHPEHDEVLHFISGTGKAVVDGVEYDVAPGVTIFVGRNRRHMFINTQQDGELHWLWFIQPNGLEDFFEQIGRPVVPG